MAFLSRRGEFLELFDEDFFVLVSLAQASKSSADSAAAAETGLLNLPLADSAAAALSLGLSADIPASDSAASAAETTSLNLSLADSGASAETPVTALSSADSGASAESPALNLNATDQAAGAESLGLSSNLPASDSAAAAETASPYLSATDSGAIAETPATALSSTDSGASAENLALNLNISDQAAGAESLGLSTALPVSDSAAAAETASPNLALTDSAAIAETPAIALSSADSGVGAENLALNLNTSDQAAAAESPGLSASLPVNDSAATAEIAGLTLTLTDTATAAEAVSSSVDTPISGADSLGASDSAAIAAAVADVGAWSESLGLSANIPASDSAIASDQTAVSLSAGDSGSAVEINALVVVPGQDAGAAADTLGLTASLPITDSGATADTLQAVPALTDSISGAEIPSVQAAGLVETAQAIESVSVVISVADAGVASEAMAVSLLVADLAVAAEALSAELRAADTATAGDGIAAALLAEDAAALSQAVSAALLAIDAASSADVADSAATLSIVDSVAAGESSAVALTISEVSVGSDAANFAAFIPTAETQFTVPLRQTTFEVLARPNVVLDVTTKMLRSGRLGAVTKRPSEKLLLTVDLIKAHSMPITLNSVTAVNRGTGASSTSAVIASSPAPQVPAGTRKITFAVQGGVLGDEHQITVRYLLAGGQMRELDLDLIVLETPAIATVTKRPWEKFLLTMDLTKAHSQPITLDSVTAVNRATGVDSTSAVIASSPAPQVVLGTRKITFAVQGGVLGDEHQITVRYLLADGQSIELNLNLNVMETPAIGAFPKQPGEKVDASVDFVKLVPVGQSISLISAASVNLATKQDSTAALIDQSAAPAVEAGTSKINFRTTDGSDGQDHRVALQIQTSDGQQFEAAVDVAVREV